MNFNCNVLFVCIFSLLFTIVLGDTWIDYPWPATIKAGERAAYDFIEDIEGRRITGVQLRRVSGGFTCTSNQFAYWGCDRNGPNFFARVYQQDTDIAPLPSSDPRVKISRGLYTIEGVNVTDSSVFISADYFVTSRLGFRVALANNGVSSIKSGSLTFMFSIRIDSFYTLATAVQLNSVAQTIKGDFQIPTPFLEQHATRFRFLHESGSVACQNGLDSLCNWGCTSEQTNAAKFCFEVFNVSGSYEYNNIVVPSDVDNRITRDKTPGYYFYLSNQRDNQLGLFEKSIELETDSVLQNITYSLQFCELAGENVTRDNTGTTNVTVQASFERWQYFGNLTIDVGATNIPIIVSIPNDMVGKRLRYVRLLHKTGYFQCDNRELHRWGCFDPSSTINETFYITMRNATDKIFPLERGYIHQQDGYKYMGHSIDDDSIVYETNSTLTNSVVIQIMSGGNLNSSLSFDIFFTIYDGNFSECNRFAGFTAYTGGYSHVWCGICRFGYDGTGYGDSCKDKNECGTKNICGNGAQCFNLPGTYNCTCRGNLVGDPQVGCVSCGNGFCEENLGENCGNCKKDCKQESCGICGDGTCEAAVNEDCRSCFTDCGACVDPTIKCPGKPECSSHGTCNAGLCSCIANFSGPACDKEVQPITVQKTDSNPDLTFMPATQADVKFQFAVFELREVNAKEETIQKIELKDENFEATMSEVTSATQPTYVLSSTLANNARLSISIWIFSENTDILFVDELLSFTSNSIKFDVSVKLWPFKSANNNLWLLTSQESPNQGKVPTLCGDEKPEGFDGSGNLRFSQIHIGETILYGRFLEYAAIDGRKKALSVKSISQSGNQIIVAIVIPFFFETAVIDPDMSVLVAAESEERECENETKSNKNRVTRTIIIAVVCSVIGATVIIGAVVGYRRYNRIQKQRRHTKRALDNDRL